MHCSHSERDPSTFLFTTLLFILSFTPSLAESADVHGFRPRHAWRRQASLSVPVIPTGLLATPTLLPTTIATGFSLTLPISLPTTLVPNLLPSFPLTSPSPSPSPSPSSSSSLQTSDPTTTPISSSDSSTPSPTLTTTTSATTSQTRVQTTSQGTQLSSSSSPSQRSSSAAPSTSGAATLGAVTPFAQNSVTPEYSGLATTASYPTGTTISATPSSETSSNSGFFSNTGAVAGTFTVAGLFGFAGVIGVGMMIARRRVSRSYEDDMEFLEKKVEPPVELSQSQNFIVGDIEESDLSQVTNSIEVTVPPAAHLYSQHDYFAHGQITNEGDGYENQDRYSQGAYPPYVYGIAYPSRGSYAAANAYGGMDESSTMPNPFDNTVTEPPAASQRSNEQLRTASPPLTAYLHRSADSFYGSSSGPSDGHAM